MKFEKKSPLSMSSSLKKQSTHSSIKALIPISNCPLLHIGARSSALSRIQVQEVLTLLHSFYPNLQYRIHYFVTTGDKDQATSLRTLDRTDFFTKEIDDWVLDGINRVGVHSAKDLPSPLKKNLSLFCLTKGLDPSDSLVLRDGQMLKNLPTGALIGTSSIRREEMIRELRKDLICCDIRGSIETRISKLIHHEVDGVIIAEAALIRLNLTHLNRIHLPGPTTEGQGKLAVVGRTDQQELKLLFKPIDNQSQEI